MVTKLTAELVEEYLGGKVAPRVTETRESGIVMVPAEYITRVMKDLDPEGHGYSGTKTSWIANMKRSIKAARGVPWSTTEGDEKWKQKRNKPVELVPFNIEEFWNLQNEIIEIVESKQTAEAMKWTFKACIARFMDKTGLLSPDANAETKENTRMNRSFERSTKTKYGAHKRVLNEATGVNEWKREPSHQVPGDISQPDIQLKRSADTL